MDDVRARLTAYRKSKGNDCTKTDIQPLHPSILWAQRSDTVLLTVSLNDIRDETFSLEENGFEFSGVGGAEGRMYEARIEFYKDILPQKFKHKKTDRGIFFEIKKREKGPYWPRLLNEPTNCPYVTVDFSRWKEEDENEEEPDTTKKKLPKRVRPASVDEVTPPTSNSRPWYVTALYVVLWLLLWGFFVEIEFGIVYIILSAFAFIVLSLRGSRRRIGELSAYSVFNENCESIEGTLTAEQFEREIRYGPAAVT